jgi:hypothetical protein
MANDLEQPGIPTIIIGSLFIIQTNEVKTFYLNDKFNAIPSGLFILLR